MIKGVNELLGMLLAASSSQVLAVQWVMEPDASRLEFVATYEGQSAPGVFRQFATQMDFDPSEPRGGQLIVEVRTASADMDSADINDTIKGRDWFDSSKYPAAKFTSTEITPDGPGRYVARGTLDLKGVGRQIVVPFTWKTSGSTATMFGTLILQRTNFNIGTGEWSTGNTIGLDVKVNFRVRLKKES
jgi:polyisoprenoid-binding protein YceI